MRHLTLLTTAFAITLVASANAAEYQLLRGSFMVGGATLIDPPADEPNKTHYYFFLTSESAQALYEAMDTAAIYDECRDDGSLMKSIDNMQCLVSADRSDYQCSFGINLSKQSVEPGSNC